MCHCTNCIAFIIFLFLHCIYCISLYTLHLSHCIYHIAFITLLSVHYYMSHYMSLHVTQHVTNRGSLLIILLGSHKLWLPQNNFAREPQFVAPSQLFPREPQLVAPSGSICSGATIRGSLLIILLGSHKLWLPPGHFPREPQFVAPYKE